MVKLKDLLSQKGLVQQSPKEEEILARAKSSDGPIRIFYGETYDEEGNPVDSVKYYFFVSSLANALRKKGFEVEPQIMIADVAATRNASPKTKERYMILGQDRIKFVNEIDKKYNLGLHIIKMSDYFLEKNFQSKLSKIKEICQSDPNLMTMIKKSVPESKIDIERKRGFAYSFDEVATIIDLDIKVGPPREDLYDEIAREISLREDKSKLMSIFLTPTFPLGKGIGYFLMNEGIENHGITAYKAGSKRLQCNRIIIGKTSREESKGLINTSFISTNPKLPNPVLDLGIICEIAKQKREGNEHSITLYEDFYSGKISPDKLKEIVTESLYNTFLK